ncbi:Holliday junction resolvase RuvX [Candidatus Parcubacteria bacterium]|nr:Holliday junction resolvase RuvX [Candidatus Parcubacteria bacterium]
MKKFLAIDYGLKRIGIALGDNESRLALPYKIIDNKNKNFVLRELKNIISGEQIDEIIIGMPYELSKETGGNPMMKNIKKFADFLKNILDTKIIFEDERSTSKVADDLLKGSKNKKRDDVAASLILQSYLDKI